MVVLTATPAILSAIKVYHELGIHVNGDITIPESPTSEDEKTTESGTQKADFPIEHKAVVKLSEALVTHYQREQKPEEVGKYRLNFLLRGCTIYVPPKPPKPEPTEEYKTLMANLRLSAEQSAYQSLLHPNDPSYLALHPPDNSADEYTLKDLKSDLSIIANVILSILATAAAVWFAARSWPVEQRLGLAFTSCVVVAVAEAVVLTGYYRRIGEAKEKEKKVKEVKEVVRTWEVSPAAKTEVGKGELRERGKGSEGKSGN